MKIGVLQLQIYIVDSQSLKQKRSSLSKLKNSLRKKFNISISELGKGNYRQSHQLGIALLGKKDDYINSIFDEILKILKNVRDIQVIDYNIQIM